MLRTTHSLANCVRLFQVYFAGFRGCRGRARCSVAVLFFFALALKAQPAAATSVDPQRQLRMSSISIRASLVDATDIRFTHLSNGQGLSQIRVSQIVQDDQGFLWFGTQQGLDRYDGYTFKVYTHDPTRPDSLSGGYVYSLLKDRSGSIWVGVDNFLDRFNPATESFTHFNVNTQTPITQISQDSHGLLWLSTENGLFRLDPATTSVVRFGHDPRDSQSLSSDQVGSSGEDRSGTFWVGTIGGIDQLNRNTGKVSLHIPWPPQEPPGPCYSACRSFHEDRFGIFWVIYGAGSGLAVLNKKTNRLEPFEFQRSDPIGPVTAMLEDHDGTMWFGTSGMGLLKFDRQHNRFLRYRRHSDDPDSLGEDRVISLFEDREGDVWECFHARIPDFFSTKPFAFETFRPGSTGLRGAFQGENLVNAIYEDQHGTIWMGAGYDLVSVDRNTKDFKRYELGGAASNAEVLAISGDGRNGLWIGTIGHGLVHYDPESGRTVTFRHRAGDQSSLSNDTVTRILSNHTGKLWISTWNGLDRFDPKTKLFTVYKRDPQATEPYYSIVEDRDGDLWLGSLSGLVHFQPDTGKFVVLEHNDRNAMSLSNDNVDSLYEDRSGVLWIGTQGGLNRMDPKAETFKAFYVQQGLPGDAVSCILGDDQNNLWMSTNNGLAKFDPLKQTFKSYSVSDGLPGNDLTGWDACYRSSSGEMLFAGFAGAIALRPSDVSDSTFIPPIAFTGFQLSTGSPEIGPRSVLTKSINDTGQITLSHKQDYFTIQFSALSFRNPATNRYRYKLIGADSDWHEVGSEQRVASYTGLPAGDYTFRVEGATERGPWNQPGRSLIIEILPPWWNSWWFRLGYVILLLLSVWYLYRLRLIQISKRFEARLEERVSERTRIARDLHDTLLQSFQGLLLRFQTASDLLAAHPVEARQTLDSAIDQAGEAITEARDAVHHLRSSVVINGDLVRAITSLGEALAGDESIRPTPTFHVEVQGATHDLDPTSRDEIYRITSEALRNAFRYSNARRVEVELHFNKRELRVRIRDDGKGIDADRLADAEQGRHYGLQGMRERARLVGGELTIWSEVNSGTEVDLVVPSTHVYLPPTPKSTSFFTKLKIRQKI